MKQEEKNSPRNTRNTRKKEKRKLDHDSLVLDFGVVAEVDEQSEAKARRFEVIVHLSAMLFSQFLDRFDLQNDLVKKDEVGRVLLRQTLSLVTKLQLLFRFEAQALQC
jgi:hypothetical protein